MAWPDDCELLPVYVDMAFGYDRRTSPDSWAWTRVADFRPDRSPYATVDRDGGPRRARLLSDTIRITRGRRAVTDQVTAAVASFQLDNVDGLFSVGGPDVIAPELELGVPVRIIVSPSDDENAEHYRFLGEITDFTWEWPAGDIRWCSDCAGEARVMVTCEGALSRLLRSRFERLTVVGTLVRDAIVHSTDTYQVTGYWPLYANLRPSDLTDNESIKTQFGKVSISEQGTTTFGDQTVLNRLDDPLVTKTQPWSTAQFREVFFVGEGPGQAQDIVQVDITETELLASLMFSVRLSFTAGNNLRIHVTDPFGPDLLDVVVNLPISAFDEPHDLGVQVRWRGGSNYRLIVDMGSVSRIDDLVFSAVQADPYIRVSEHWLRPNWFVSEWTVSYTDSTQPVWDFDTLPACQDLADTLALTEDFSVVASLTGTEPTVPQRGLETDLEMLLRVQSVNGGIVAEADPNMATAFDELVYISRERLIDDASPGPFLTLTARDNQIVNPYQVRRSVRDVVNVVTVNWNDGDRSGTVTRRNLGLIDLVGQQEFRVPGEACTRDDAIALAVWYRKLGALTNSLVVSKLLLDFAVFDRLATGVANGPEVWGPIVSGASPVLEGRILRVEQLPCQHPEGEAVDLMIQGWTEVLGHNHWSIEFNTTPGEPWLED